MSNESAMQKLTLDNNDWHYVNGSWRASDDGVLDVEHCDDDTGMQGMHFAFNTALCQRDTTMQFEVRLPAHSDAGIVFGAHDAGHFYLLHFPNCAQASRAQHFWVALSKMDNTGYLRLIAFELVRRVQSTPPTWLAAELRLRGAGVEVKIGDYGRFTTTLDTVPEPGHIGLFTWLSGQLRNVQVAAETAPAVWRDGIRQRRNWQYPLPLDEPVWQQPLDMKRFDNGELLLLLNLPLSLNQGDDAKAAPHLSRSDDDGNSWSKPEPFAAAGVTSAWGGARMHLTPQGRLLVYLPQPAGKSVYVSTDRGRTWNGPESTSLHVGPRREEPVQSLSPHGFLNLADGGILAFQISRSEDFPADYPIFTWGSMHCNAWAARSDDDGMTWSGAVSLDNHGSDTDGNPIPGNLDLTEAAGIQLASGRVLVFIRPIFSPWMWQTWSDDGGRSWGPCLRGPFPGYAAPNMLRTSSGAILIAHRLPCLTINCSHDEGVTWDAGTVIDGGLWAMGSMCEIAPDLVLYLYWDNDNALTRQQRFRVTPDGLAPM